MTHAYHCLMRPKHPACDLYNQEIDMRERNTGLYADARGESI